MATRLRNYWRWLGGWSPEACAAVDWAAALFPPEIQERGIARAYYDLIWTLDQILRALPRSPHGLRVLDVGCGAGVLALALRHLGACVTAVDRFDEYEGACDNQMGNTRAIMDRFEQQGIEVISRDVVADGLPAGEGAFDLATCFAMIEHLPESPRALLAQMHRALGAAGLVAITTPNQAWIRTRLRLLFGRSAHDPLADWWTPPFYGHVREYTLAELQSMLEWSGFQIVTATRGNWWHASSRIRSHQRGEPDRWTTRLTLDSPERWITASSLFTTALVPSARYTLLGIGRR
jgi:SAM-dependent methyltransferase